MSSHDREWIGRRGERTPVYFGRMWRGALAVCGVPSRPINEGAVMKYWRKFMLMAFLLIPVVGLSTGCEVDADADDDGAELKIDTD
jgi:hypothetical protein